MIQINAQDRSSCDAASVLFSWLHSKPLNEVLRPIRPMRRAASQKGHCAHDGPTDDPLHRP